MSTGRPSEKEFTIIDLFAGCGGFSQGFLKAGFKVIAASEFWNPAIETYKENHKSVSLIEGDITLTEKKQELYDSVQGKNVNVIIGGPPCQGYSQAGNRNPDDPRGQLYLDFIEIIDTLKPDLFVMENVKGLLNMKHVNPELRQKELVMFKLNCDRLQRYKDLKRYAAQRDLNGEEKTVFDTLKRDLKKIQDSINSSLIPLLDKILNKFKEIGYRVSWKILNSADYGVAQARERIIFIGTKHDAFKLKFPEPTHFKETSQKSIDIYTNSPSGDKKSWITSKSILEQYENWPESTEKSHLFTRHSKDFIKRLQDTPIGGNVYENYTDAWWRLDPDKPARTVKENHGGVFVHYKFDRVCTPRELAALQSFDNEFLFKGNKSVILKQIGNAVPPLMAKAIAMMIRENLEKLNPKREEITTSV